MKMVICNGNVTKTLKVCDGFLNIIIVTFISYALEGIHWGPGIGTTDTGTPKPNSWGPGIDSKRGKDESHRWPLEFQSLIWQWSRAMSLWPKPFSQQQQQQHSWIFTPTTTTTFLITIEENHDYVVQTKQTLFCISSETHYFWKSFFPYSSFVDN